MPRGQTSNQPRDNGNDRPARSRRSDLPLYLALLLLPLATGALTVQRVGFEFRGQMGFDLASPTSAGGKAQPANSEAYRKELIGGLWHLQKERLARGKPPFVWSVDSERDGGLTLSLQATDVEETYHLLDRAYQEFVDRAAAARAHSADRVQAHSRTVRARLGEIAGNLQGIGTALANTNDDASAEESVAELTAGWQQMDSIAEQYRQVRARLDDVRARRKQLTDTTVVTAVDPADRTAAYQADEPLQQAIKQLAVESVQVRRSTQQVWTKAQPQIQAQIQSAESLNHLLGRREVAGWNGEQRLRLERIADAAADVHDHSDRVAKDVAGLMEQMKAAPIETEDAPILVAFEKLVSRLDVYLARDADLVDVLSERVQLFYQLPGQDPTYHTISAAVADTWRSLTSARDSFVAGCRSLSSRDNYALHASRRSARGLKYRVERLSREIDKRLEAEALAQARRQRDAEIAQLDRRTTELRNQLGALVDSLFQTQDRLQSLTAAMPERIQADVNHRMQRATQSILSDEADRLRGQLSQLDSDFASPVDPNAIVPGEPTVSKRPANIAALICYGLMAWSLTFLGIAGTHRLVCGKSRA